MEETLRLYMDSRGLTWDEVTFPEAKWADLNEESVRAFLERARHARQWGVDPQTPVRHVLEQLRLVRGEQLTAAALLLFGHQPQRNKLIAQAFFLAGLIEGWGTGTLRMMEACREAGLPDPEFLERGGAFIVTFRSSRLSRDYLAALGLNERQIRAVEYLREHGQMTNADYVRLNNVSRRWATEELKALVEKGIFQHQGRGKGSVYIFPPTGFGT